MVPCGFEPVVGRLSQVVSSSKHDGLHFALVECGLDHGVIPLSHDERSFEPIVFSVSHDHFSKKRVVIEPSLAESTARGSAYVQKHAVFDSTSAQ